MLLWSDGRSPSRTLRRAMARREETTRRARENTAALRRVFALIDTDGSGSLSAAELSAIMGADASALMVAADAATGLDFAQFQALVEPSEFFCQSRVTFDALDVNDDGRVTRDEVEQWLLQQLAEDEARSRAAKLTGKWATRGGAYRGKAADEPVSFADFFLFVTQSARKKGEFPVLHALGRTGGRAAHGLPAMGDRTIGELAGFKVNFGDVWGRYGTGLYETPGGKDGGAAVSSQTASRRATVLRHMAAGAVAGTLAKTAIAPCDRIKIMFQVSDRAFSIRAALRHGTDIVHNEGVLRLWKGHSAMVARVLPYASIHFAAHEQLNASLAPKPGEKLPIERKFVSGAAAGAVSTVCTYPLDLLRARMAVEEGQISFSKLVTKVVGEGGTGALFRGVGPTLTGIMPYSGTAWLVKETVGENLPLFTGRQLSTADRVLCGVTGGLTGQLLTYPLDVTRRRMQVHGGTMLQVIRDCYTVEGMAGLFKGFSLNCIKGPIAAGISFTAFDLLKHAT